MMFLVLTTRSIAVRANDYHRKAVVSAAHSLARPGDKLSQTEFCHLSKKICADNHLAAVKRLCLYLALYEFSSNRLTSDHAPHSAADKVCSRLRHNADSARQWPNRRFQRYDSGRGNMNFGTNVHVKIRHQ